MSTSRSGTSKKKKTVKQGHPIDGNILHPEALGFDLGDGNADKEAEKLKPSPNFYVHKSFVLESKNIVRWLFKGSVKHYVIFSHRQSTFFLTFTGVYNLHVSFQITNFSSFKRCDIGLLWSATTIRYS
jgi:hypothetical protein